MTVVCSAAVLPPPDVDERGPLDARLWGVLPQPCRAGLDSHHLHRAGAADHHQETGVCFTLF